MQLVRPSILTYVFGKMVNDDVYRIPKRKQIILIWCRQKAQFDLAQVMAAPPLFLPRRASSEDGLAGLGLAVDPGDLTDVEVGSSLFLFNVEVWHAYTIYCGVLLVFPRLRQWSSYSGRAPTHRPRPAVGPNAGYAERNSCSLIRRCCIRISF